MEEYHDLVEETKVSNGDYSLHSANEMQDTGGALEHLSMAARAGKEIITNLTEVVETLPIKNASLTTQLSNTMIINLDMAKKLKIKATQAQDPEDKRMAEKSRKKSNFESKLDLDGYCWTHRLRVTNRNIRQTCSTPVAGNQRTASRKISWEEARQANDTSGWGWKSLNY